MKVTVKMTAGLLVVLAVFAGSGARAATIEVTDRYVIDSAEKIAEITASSGLNIHAGAVVDYATSENLTLTVPVTGSGTFRVVNCAGTLTLAADSRDFAGSWALTNSPVVVANRYGLGSSVTRGAFVQNDEAHKDCLHFAGEGLTCDVPISVGAGGYRFKDRVADKLVFNGKFTRRGLCKFSAGNVYFRGGYDGNSGSPQFEPQFDDAADTTEAWTWFDGGFSEHGYLQIRGSNKAVSHYVITNANPSAVSRIGRVLLYRGYLHCGMPNIFGPAPEHIVLGGKYNTREWRTAVFDLGGYSQSAQKLYCQWQDSVLEADGETYLTEVTSATDATLTLTDAAETTATKFTGAVSLMVTGAGKTYALANLLSTSTGRLTVANGAAVVLKWGAGWSGSVSIGDGSRLTAASTRAFVGGVSEIEVAAGGVLEVPAGATVAVKSLRLGDYSVPGGRYTVATLKAAGYADFVAGDGEVTVIGSETEVVAGPHPMDALVFDLALPNETVGATCADLDDAVSHSATAPCRPSAITAYDSARDAAGFAAYGQPELISVRREPVIDNYRYKLYVTNEMNVLHFPKNQRTANGQSAVFAQGLRYDVMPSLTSNVTFYIRYRWSGNFVQPHSDNSSYQYDQYLFQLVDPEKGQNLFAAAVEAAPPDVRQGFAIPRYSVGGNQYTMGMLNVMSGVDIGADHWVDAFYVCERVADGTKVTVYRLDVGQDSPAFRRWDLTTTQTMDFPVGGSMRLILGNVSKYFGNSSLNGQSAWLAENGNAAHWVYAAFTGDIANFKIFNRALTPAEINAVLGGGAGGMTFKVGGRNGSGDEFAAAGDAAVADPFDPVRMAPRRMRKMLDAAHPTLTLKFPLLAEEARLAKTFRMVAQRKDVLGSVPVTLSVNGVEAGRFDFGSSDTGFAFIPCSLMTRDAQGEVTITLSRPSPVVGELVIDTLELSGSWAAGVENGSSSDWCFADVTQIASYTGWFNRLNVVGGAWGVPYLYQLNYGRRKDGNANYYPAQEIAFDLPQEVLAAECPLTFEFGRDMGVFGELDVYVNGTAIYHDGPQANGFKTRTLTIPPELVNPGYNTLCISNATCTYAEEQGTSAYNPVIYDSFRFSFKPPARKGLLVIFR